MIEIAAIVGKELKTIMRDPVGLFMLFVLPAIFIIVLSVALQGVFSSGNTSERLEVLAINRDLGELGEKILEGLNRTEIFKTVTGEEKISDKSIRELIDDGSFEMAIIVPPKFTEAVFFKDDAVVEILVDPTLSNEVAYSLKSAAENIAHGFSMDALRKKVGLDPGGAGRSGLKVERVFVSSSENSEMKPNEVQQNVPGWTIFALFWISQLLALSIVGERLKGSYRRILLSPANTMQYLVGKTVPFLLINIAQAVVMFGLGVLLLPLLGCSRLQIGSYPALLLVTVAISLVANGFGVFMASISKSETFVASISAALIIIMCVIGGIMVPKFVMPSYMQKMSLFVPHGWAMEAYQDIIVRNFGIAKTAHYLGILAAWALAFFSMGAVAMKRWRSYE
jgi:ABC-2 type transport system permease protein